MVDRTFFYPSEEPLDTTFLTDQRNGMIGLGYAQQATLGTGTVVDALQCIPTVPASLAVQILPGAIYQQTAVDTTPYGGLPVDTVDQIIKQGIILTTTNLTLTPPGTSGQAINYLVEAALQEQDVGSTVLPYFNAANPTIAFSGPNGLGTAQPTIRQCTVHLVAKAGIAATAGSQTTPTPDVGFVGLWAVTVANGATALTASQIAQYSAAPFISVKLPQVPTWVQGGTWAWALDTGTANQIIVNMVPTPTTIQAGFEIRVQKMSAPSTGAMTIVVNGASATAVTYADGSAMSVSTVMAANYLARLVYNGTAWRWTNAPISTAVGALTASSGEGINVSGTAVVSQNLPSLSVEPIVSLPDLFMFYSQADGHHRVLSWAQFLAALRAQLPLQTLTAPLSYFVNSNTGSDANTGLSLASPFATIQRAIVGAQSFNMNGFNVTIFVANGNYAPFVGLPLNGAGLVTIEGNATNPGNVLVHSTAGEAINIKAPQYFIQGVAVQSDARGTAGSYGSGIRASATVSISDIQFNACFDDHMLVDPNGFIGIDGSAVGNSSAFITVAGSANNHMRGSGVISINTPILNINPGTYSFLHWAFCSRGYFLSGSISGGSPYSVINNSGTVLGQKFLVSAGGLIDTQGAGVGYFPGNTAGQAFTNGLYL